MKRFFVFLAIVLFVPGMGYSQDSTKVNTGPPIWTPPYGLVIPAGWQVERFKLPPNFAWQIPLKGHEDLRFTPGWGDSLSKTYWSYAFLWWLDDQPRINDTLLQKYLESYYTGLVGLNIIRRKIPASKRVPVTVTVKSINAESGDMETYTATINMLDYMAQQPITLNCRVHLKVCKSQNHMAIFFELSPKAFGDEVWLELNKIQESFECGN
jgi:hypothetical protein